MVENNRFLDILTWVVLAIGIVIIGFPVYVTFVASTLTAPEVLQAPMTLVPGGHFITNYRTALFDGVGESAIPVGKMLLNSLWMALGVALGKILVSILSAFAIAMGTAAAWRLTAGVYGVTAIGGLAGHPMWAQDMMIFVACPSAAFSKDSSALSLTT